MPAAAGLGPSPDERLVSLIDAWAEAAGLDDEAVARRLLGSGAGTLRRMRAGDAPTTRFAARRIAARVSHLWPEGAAWPEGITPRPAPEAALRREPNVFPRRGHAAYIEFLGEPDARPGRAGLGGERRPRTGRTRPRKHERADALFRLRGV